MGIRKYRRKGQEVLLLYNQMSQLSRRLQTIGPLSSMRAYREAVRKYNTLRGRVEEMIGISNYEYDELPSIHTLPGDRINKLFSKYSNAAGGIVVAIWLSLIIVLALVPPIAKSLGANPNSLGLSIVVLARYTLMLSPVVVFTLTVISSAFDPRGGSDLREKIADLEEVFANFVIIEYPDLGEEMWPSRGKIRLPSKNPESVEATETFTRIELAISDSAIEKGFKDVSTYDLEQAKNAYRAGAFKACIVMLGAVLEGVMLGTLRRTEVINMIRSDEDPPAVLKRLGLRGGTKADLADKIADTLGFEEYRQTVQYYIPEIESLKIEGIQTFRNAVHPWRTVRNPEIYGDPDRTRAMNHLTALALLVDCILAWNPWE